MSAVAFNILRLAMIQRGIKLLTKQSGKTKRGACRLTSPIQRAMFWRNVLSTNIIGTNFEKSHLIAMYYYKGIKTKEPKAIRLRLFDLSYSLKPDIYGKQQEPNRDDK